MYHYVRTESRALPHFRYLHLENFKKQLDFLCSRYRILGRQEFLDAVQEGRCPSDAVVLTFDDGLLDHYQFVLPELERRQLWGIFYVVTGPLETDSVLSVHLVHRLLGKYGGPKMLDALKAIVEPEMLTHAHVREFKTLTYPDQADDLEATTLFKRILNYFISNEWQRPILMQLMEKMPLDNLDDIYLNRAQIQEMHSCGHLIGSHSGTHPLFSKLISGHQESEIQGSFDFLEEILGEQPIRTFCYPYGGFHSFTPETEKLLSDAGCKFSFNVEYRDIEINDLKCRPQALPRYDCNLFMHGRAS